MVLDHPFFIPTIRGGLTFVRTKVSKNPRRDVRSTFCTKNFLEIVAVVIRKLIALTPKITHQQREMICAILRQFFQILLNDLQSLSLRRICLNGKYVPQNYMLIFNFCLFKITYFPTKKVCVGDTQSIQRIIFYSKNAGFSMRHDKENHKV